MFKNIFAGDIVSAVCHLQTRIPIWALIHCPVSSQYPLHKYFTTVFVSMPWNHQPTTAYVQLSRCAREPQMALVTLLPVTSWLKHAGMRNSQSVSAKWSFQHWSCWRRIYEDKLGDITCYTYGTYLVDGKGEKVWHFIWCHGITVLETYACIKQKQANTFEDKMHLPRQVMQPCSSTLIWKATLLRYCSHGHVKVLQYEQIIQQELQYTTWH